MITRDATFNSQEGLTNCLLDLLQQLGVDAVFG
jgi:hypothetical protein